MSQKKTNIINNKFFSFTSYLLSFLNYFHTVSESRGLAQSTKQKGDIHTEKHTDQNIRTQKNIYTK